MPELIFDDIGSYPKPKGFVFQGLDEDYASLVRDTMAQKISSGLDVPTYPQFRDMIRMFMDLIEDPKAQEFPYLVKKDRAEIFELEALKGFCRDRPIRVCVTGPLELYLSAFGATSYEDILYNLARSVALFLEKAMETVPVRIASVDEPSLGLSSNLVFDQDQIQKALEIASRPCRDIDCEVHLHSPLYAELCCNVSSLSVVGVESAANPDYLRLIDKKMLEDTDTYIRAGIARTDILSLAAKINDRLGRNLWECPEELEIEILAAESPEVIEKRLFKAYSIFGDRMRCAGPDCGLGSWPSQRVASSLLSNCSKAIASFKESFKR
jgi:5-methyltetrahydropteroyltriglutamate--homocysteine methyltransferase